MIKNYIKAAFIYASVILGAGFASGREILSYFVDYGVKGFWGLVLSGVIFFVTGWAIWEICRRENIYTYKQFMDKTVGVKFAAFIEIILGLFMFIVYSAMLAAAGASMNESFGLSYSAGVYSVATICFIVFLFDMSGILKLNEYMAPIMIIGCIGVSLYTLTAKTEPVFIQTTAISDFMKKNWWMASVTYTAYNIITAIPLLSSMKGMLSEKKETFKAGLWAGVIMGLLGICIALALVKNYAQVSDYEIPMLKLAISYGAVLKYMYMALFLLAVFTTAATNGFAVIEWLSGRYFVNKFILKLAVSFLGIIAAYMGFSNFVANVYPLFALAGAAEILLILKYFLFKPSIKAKAKG